MTYNEAKLSLGSVVYEAIAGQVIRGKFKWTDAYGLEFHHSSGWHKGLTCVDRYFHTEQEAWRHNAEESTRQAERFLTLAGAA